MSIKQYRLKDIARIERAKKGKTYPAGSVLIQVSATRGQIDDLKCDGPAEPKDAVVTAPDVYPGYLVHAISQVWMPYYMRTRQGINYPPEHIGDLIVPIHTTRQEQKAVVDAMRERDEAIRQEEEIIAQLLELKRYFLGTMFPRDNNAGT